MATPSTQVVPLSRLQSVTSRVSGDAVGTSDGPKASIKQQSRLYFAALGAHIAMLRKTRGMTQAELARAIGVSQQAVFAYELGDRRVSVLVLIKLARVFSMSLPELAGLAVPARMPKRRLSPRAMRHAERLQALSKTEQRFVVRIIDTIEAGKVKWNANQHSRKAM